jgi:hypothetical protein
MKVGAASEGQIWTAIAGAAGKRAPKPKAAAADQQGEEEPSPFAKVLRGLSHEIDRGEAVARKTMSGGGQLGAGELLALQAGVYRYSEAVDLASKIVDRASSGVKTVLQGQ